VPGFGRYFQIFCASALVLLIVIGAVSHYAAKTQLDAVNIFSYQLKKLEGLHGALGTVFVGDSALGNAIDAREFTALSGLPSLNLALTQAYGYVGAWEMLRRVLRVARPRNVVIMQGIDILKRDSDQTMYVAISDDAALSVSFGDRLQAAADYLQLIYGAETLKREFLHAVRGDRTVRDWPDDYVPQGSKLKVTSEAVPKNILQPGYNPEKLRFLRQFVTLCAAERLNCIYAHGPMLADLCPGSQAYFAEASKAIRETGIRLLADTPECVPEADIGDLPGHLSVASKTAYTQKYYRLLAPDLK
jgi:hypothetical protein